MSLAEQSGATIEGPAPVQPKASVKTQHSSESQQISSPIQEEAEEGDSSTEDESGSDSDSDSSSESDDESESELESSAGPVAPLEGSPDLPSRENLFVIQGARADQGQDSQKLGAVSSSKEHHTQKESTPISSEKLKDQKYQNIQPTKPLKSMIDFPFDEIFF